MPQLGGSEWPDFQGDMQSNISECLAQVLMISQRIDRTKWLLYTISFSQTVYLHESQLFVVAKEVSSLPVRHCVEKKESEV